MVSEDDHVHNDPGDKYWLPPATKELVVSLMDIGNFKPRSIEREIRRRGLEQITD